MTQTKEKLSLIQQAKEFITTIPINKISIKDLLGFEKTPRNLLIATITLAFIAMFVIGVAMYVMYGHHVYNVTREHPWGLLIVVYIFFVVSSTGLCIIGSLGDVFGFKDYELILDLEKNVELIEKVRTFENELNDL